MPTHSFHQQTLIDVACILYTFCCCYHTLNMNLRISRYWISIIIIGWRSRDIALNRTNQLWTSRVHMNVVTTTSRYLIWAWLSHLSHFRFQFQWFNVDIPSTHSHTERQLSFALNQSFCNPLIAVGYTFRAFSIIWIIVYKIVSDSLDCVVITRNTL